MTTAGISELRLDKGLANTIASESQMSFIDGANGVLEYVGLDIDSLARQSSFEETVYLLWNRRLPTRSELDTFTAQVRAEYQRSHSSASLRVASVSASDGSTRSSAS